MIVIRSLPLDRCNWNELDAMPDRLVYQTREWLGFLSRTQQAEPVVAEMTDGDGARVGYFTGMVMKRYGVRILGSPFPGWSTGPMGFNLAHGVDRREALRALVAHAFGPLRCMHLELLDRGLTFDDAAGLGFRWEPSRTYGIRLDRDEDEIFGTMNSACRRAIRKGQKMGVTIEQARHDDFGDEYYAQLEDVFAKQSLRPQVSVGLVRELIRSLEPAGRILLLRAVSAEGERVATGIFVGMNKVAYYWGGASWREHQQLRPNETLMWHAIRWWKARGAEVLDLGGGTEEGFAGYKRKFGPVEYTIPALRISRFRAVGAARDVAEVVVRRGLPRLRSVRPQR